MLKGADPGTLDRRVTIQTRSISTDAYGSPIEAWADTATVWAGVDYPKTGSLEQFYDAVNIATTSVTFTIRYRAVSLSENRVKYNGEEYDIERVGEIGRRNFTTLGAKLRQNDGR